MTYKDFVDIDATDRAFERIAQAIMERKVEFLLGAGMSADSKVPMGGGLASKLLRRFFPPSGVNPPSDERITELVENTPFEVLVEAVEASSGKKRLDLTDDLKEILVKPDYYPKPG